MYRKQDDHFEVLLVHPGGPLWTKKDRNAWSIPKGEFEAGEKPHEAAIREFREETGFNVSGDFIELKEVKQPSGKIVYIWAVEGDLEATEIVSNEFEMEWPPRSGEIQKFPEIDQAGWFTLDQAKDKMFKGQIPILEQLEGILHEI